MSVGDRQLGRQVPTGLIDDQHRLGAGIDERSTDRAISGANPPMASVSHQGMIRARRLSPSRAQIAPKI